MPRKSSQDTTNKLIQAAGLQKGKPTHMRDRGGRVLNYHALMYILKGHGSFEDENTSRREVKPGTFFYLFPDRWHNFDPDPETVWTEYWVVFDGREAERRFGDLVPPDGPIFDYVVEPRLKEAYERLYEMWFFEPNGSGIYSSFLLHQILVEFYMAATRQDLEARADVWDRALKSMKSRLSEKTFDFEGFAESEGLSYEGFRKSFRHRLGMPPNQYFLMLKINRAKELLVRARRSVKEAAFELGFDDPYYFSRLFKKKVGTPPGSFRKQGELEKWTAERRQ